MTLISHDNPYGCAPANSISQLGKLRHQEAKRRRRLSFRPPPIWSPGLVSERCEPGPPPQGSARGCARPRGAAQGAQGASRRALPERPPPARQCPGGPGRAGPVAPLQPPRQGPAAPLFCSVSARCRLRPKKPPRRHPRSPQLFIFIFKRGGAPLAFPFKTCNILLSRS